MIGDWLARTWPKTLSIGSIRGRLALFLALALLPAGAIAIQTGVNIAASRSAAVSDRAAADAQGAHNRVSAIVSEMADVLRVMSTARELRNVSPSACQRTLDELAETYRALGSIAMMDRGGFLRCSVPEAPPGMRASSIVFRRAMERRELTFGYLERAQLVDRQVLAATAPIRGADDAIIGFVSLTSPIERIQRAARADNGDLRIVLVDASGNPIGPPLREASLEFAPPPIEQVRTAINATPMRFRFGDAEALVAPLHAPDIYLLAAWRPPSRSLSDRLAFAFAVGWPLLMWLIAIAVAWLAIEAFVSRPLSQVEQSARDYVRGSELRTDSISKNAPDEIRSLSRTLAAMARTLRAREQRLAEALREERALLREVHHRVKNNLQVVASLLNIQARSAQDSSEAWGLARAHDRVQLLSTIHQRIYSSGEVREVRLDEITREIARNLTHARSGAIAEMELELSLGEVRCDIDHAVPMGFLIGESLSSALDMAPQRGREKIVIHMQQDPDGGIRFTINAPVDPRLAANQDGRVRLIEAFARQLGADIARNVTNRYRVWGATPPLLAA